MILLADVTLYAIDYAVDATPLSRYFRQFSLSFFAFRAAFQIRHCCHFRYCFDAAMLFDVAAAIFRFADGFRAIIAAAAAYFR